MTNMERPKTVFDVKLKHLPPVLKYYTKINLYIYFPIYLIIWTFFVLTRLDFYPPWQWIFDFHTYDLETRGLIIFFLYFKIIFQFGISWVQVYKTKK